MPPTNKAHEKRSFDVSLPFKIAVGLALAVILALTLAQVVLRYFFDSPLLWSEELSRLLVVWMTFIGAAVVCWQGRHLSVDVFVVLLPKGARRIVRLINQILALGFLTILTWKSFRIVKLENFQEMSILPLPAGTVRLAATVGAILMIVAIISRIFLSRRLHSKQPDNNDSSML
ncbi:TRAP transporter small permease [Thalassospira sp. UBA1131]|uniref:TRAP transporter small permease n=1 Tax=Thalassospira sp. UBA1131 TaxID=1947672 RepID=UPI0025D706E6|nr:TRAP transporter small permease [Thalassospira sp. UBA1131]